ncbi:MAG: hypothetical protein JSU81_09070 [Candidatus Coatesbacteria bacterium]|nr:MAG: hypothetical protein JSU81_09070 [Candidatus Coatesbacteria bacterium]
MKIWVVLLTGVLAAAGATWAADVAVDGGPYGSSPAVSAPVPTDQSTLELKWDNGLRRWSVAWYTGAGSWVGNDFDISTLDTSYVKILKYKYYTRGAWPNQGWEGMRFAVYNFGGGVPGSRLWPTSGSGYFWRPSGGINAHIWVEFDVNWTCPSVKFLAAQEQFYNWPQCDPFAVDNNATFLRHSWQYYGGQWQPYAGSSDPYYNLMIRVWVETGVEFPGVEPSSIGRVKALYY